MVQLSFFEERQLREGNLFKKPSGQVIFAAIGLSRNRLHLLRVSLVSSLGSGVPNNVSATRPVFSAKRGYIYF